MGASILTNRLTRLAFERGWSDAQLAARARLSRSQLNRIRNGHAIPRVSTALALGSALEKPVSDIFCLAGVIPPAWERTSPASAVPGGSSGDHPCARLVQLCGRVGLGMDTLSALTRLERDTIQKIASDRRGPLLPRRAARHVQGTAHVRYKP